MKKWECLICGYIHEGEEPPDECPICGAGSDQFVEVKVPEAQAVEHNIESTPPKTAPSPSTDQQQSTVAKNLPEDDEATATIEAQTPPNLLDKARQLIVEHHLHPITVHSPNGIIPVAFIFLLLSLLFQSAVLETAAFYNLIVVLLTMPLVLFTGYTAWQIKYRGAVTSIFKIKITASAVATALLFILVIWRAMQPEVMTAPGSGKWIFLMLAVLLIAAVGIAGHLGGKLVFGGRK